MKRLAFLSLALLPSLAVAQTFNQETPPAGITIAPPAPVTPPPADAPKDSAEPLAPIRIKQIYTTNALIGYVNSQPVFVGDMLRPIHEELLRLASQPDQSLANFRREARVVIDAQLKRHISDILILQAARDALTDDDKQRLDAFIAQQRFNLLSKHGGSTALADQALKVIGSSVEREMSDKRRSMTVDLYLSKKLFPRIVVTRAMIVDAYEKDQKKWTQEPELELFTITIPYVRFLKETGPDGKLVTIQNPTPAQIQMAEAQALAQAKSLITRINNGEDWAPLAEEFSADNRAKEFGGRWPKVRKGALAREELEKLAFATPANTLADPLFIREKDPTQSVLILAKVGSKKEQRTIPFSEAQATIYKKLREEQYMQLTSEYMAKLYKDAAVEAADRMTETALEAAVSRYATGIR